MLSIGYTSGRDDQRLDDRGIYHVLRSERGPTAAYIRKLGKEVTVIAKLLAGVKTGRLKKSIKMSRDRSYTGGYGVIVGADVRHALVHHQGARPHIIKPKSPRGVLVFQGRAGIVRTTLVRHPGHKANPYLVAALKRVIR